MKQILTVSLAMFILGCAGSQKTDAPTQDKFSDIHPPTQVYASDTVRTSVDSIALYYHHAQETLSINDTLGAKIYFEKAFNVIAGFSEETKGVLLEWAEYDSLMKNLTQDYEKIYQHEIVEQEAEEVREALTSLEEAQFGDFDSLAVVLEADTLDTLSIPLEVNNRVELALKYFQTKGRDVFTVWLTRMSRYNQMIEEVLKEHNLPNEIKYIAMIESGFNPKAYSYARAAGMWQFISATGSYYGLRNNWWFDERRDPYLATHAAARHFIDLYGRFDDWYLAMAGYNCNPKKVERRMREYNTRDFWKLKRLPRQTRNYIPTFIAAAIIAEDPDKFGFVYEESEPIAFDTVRVHESIDLQVVANCVDTTFEVIKDLNPAVLRWCTPPGIKDFTLNLPAGTKDLFREKYSKVPEEEKRSYVRHRIRSGETLSTIAAKYHTSVSVLKSFNQLRGSMIRAGRYLVIPVPQNKGYYVEAAPVATKRRRSAPKRKVENIEGYKKIAYKVKQGDTLGEIAEQFNTRASSIRSWNGLSYGRYIYPGQTLNIFVPGDRPATVSEPRKTAAVDERGVYYTVRRGDTLWDIAKKYQVSIESLKKMNNMRTSRIRAGERIKVAEAGG